jgi:hypothetical protein
MSGIFCGDIVIKNTLELGFEDIRKNPWIIDHIFSSLTCSPLIAEKYGNREVKNAKDFFLNNETPVLMQLRKDATTAFYISIGIGSSDEDKSLATLGDATVDTKTYEPNDIGKPISYIVKPFSPIAYDKVNGIVTMPEVEGSKYVSKDMMAIDPETGDAFIIIESIGENQFSIEPGVKIPKKLGIVPRYPYWKARVEGATFQESWHIGVHCHGDPAFLIYLHAITLYTLLRYREGLLEHEGFDLSNLSSTDVIKSTSHESIGENSYTRFIILTGQVSQTWVKQPQRTIEGVDLIDTEDEGAPEGIKIISKKRLKGVDEQNGLWTTIDSEEE